MINPIQVQNYFNKAAETYDDNCYIQIIIGKKLINLTKALRPDADNIIDLGCGTGIITEILVQANQYFKHFYAIDIADKFLVKTQERLSKYNINIFEQNFDNLNYFNILFDLAFANMALQWSKNLCSTLTIINKNLNPGGILAFSMPIYETFQELDEAVTLPFYKNQEINDMLEQQNFQILYSSEHCESITYPSFICALKSIKKVGANYYKKENIGSLFKLRKLVNQEFSLTYKIGLFIALKKG